MRSSASSFDLPFELTEPQLSIRPLSEPPPSLVLDIPGPSMAPGRSRLASFWRLFFVVRVGVLLGVLCVLLVFGVNDYVGRQARLEWERPLDVALVLVLQRPLDERTIRAFRERADHLERQIGMEFSKYRPGAAPPIRFYVYGPVEGSTAPQPTGRAALFDQLIESVARLTYAWKLDRLAGVPLFGFDSRIYIAAQPALRQTTQFIEGFSEQGGRRGFVDVELDPTMIDFALFVATHELFHTLGAKDKYDDQGHTLVPAGLANPLQVPLFPQAQAEVMAHGRPLQPSVEEPPARLHELGVGPETARELRWIQP